jgi:hypothetical protein
MGLLLSQIPVLIEPAPHDASAAQSVPHSPALSAPLNTVKPPAAPRIPPNFLTPPFRGAPYRNFRIHYWIDPQDLHFVRTPNGLYHEELRTTAIVYRDDGIAANSYTTITHFDLNAADVEAIQASGFTLDQTLAVPTTDDNFFLRAAVDEEPTGRIGAIEIPAEWAKTPPPTGQLPLQAGR